MIVIILILACVILLAVFGVCAYYGYRSLCRPRRENASNLSLPFNRVLGKLTLGYTPKGKPPVTHVHPGGVETPTVLDLKYFTSGGTYQGTIMQIDILGDSGKSYDLWAFMDTGSMYLVATSNACSCGDPQKMGEWSTQESGQITTLPEQTFSYGTGQYKGYYWQAKLLPNKTPFAFGVIEQVVQSAGSGMDISICGLIHMPPSQPLSSYTFMNQVYTYLASPLPHAFVTDFVNMKLSIGAVLHGKRIKLATASDINSVLGTNFGYLPYYIVKVRGLYFTPSSGGNRINITAPPFALMDTGTTVPYVNFATQYALPSSLSGSGTITYIFEGEDGSDVSMSSDMFGLPINELQGSLNWSQLADFCICGFMAMKDSALSWVLSDAKSSTPYMVITQ